MLWNEVPVHLRRSWEHAHSFWAELWCDPSYCDIVPLRMKNTDTCIKVSFQSFTDTNVSMVISVNYSLQRMTSFEVKKRSIIRILQHHYNPCVHTYYQYYSNHLIISTQLTVMLLCTFLSSSDSWQSCTATNKVMFRIFVIYIFFFFFSGIVCCNLKTWCP